MKKSPCCGCKAEYEGGNQCRQCPTLKDWERSEEIKIGEKMKSPYFNRIRWEIACQGKIGIDARHVEAYMRLEHPTLDGLSKKQFEKEVTLGILCVETDGPENAEKCAKSFGL